MCDICRKFYLYWRPIHAVLEPEAFSRGVPKGRGGGNLSAKTAMVPTIFRLAASLQVQNIDASFVAVPDSSLARPILLHSPDRR